MADRIADQRPFTQEQKGSGDTGETPSKVAPMATSVAL